jgi:hypothetical protein
MRLPDGTLALQIKGDIEQGIDLVSCPFQLWSDRISPAKISLHDDLSLLEKY